MSMQRYSVNHYPIKTLLTWINSGEIAIPEIWRSFVWSVIKVRGFINSLYAGYLIAKRTLTVKLKNGTLLDQSEALTNSPTVSVESFRQYFESIIKLQIYFERMETGELQ